MQRQLRRRSSDILIFIKETRRTSLNSFPDLSNFRFKEFGFANVAADLTEIVNFGVLFLHPNSVSGKRVSSTLGNVMRRKPTNIHPGDTLPESKPGVVTEGGSSLLHRARPEHCGLTQAQSTHSGLGHNEVSQMIAKRSHESRRGAGKEETRADTLVSSFCVRRV